MAKIEQVPIPLQNVLYKGPSIKDVGIFWPFLIRLLWMAPNHVYTDKSGFKENVGHSFNLS